MKKIALSIGIVLIILLSGIWVYLLFFSTETSNNDLFALFNFNDTTDSSVTETIDEVVGDIFGDEPAVDVAPIEPLRQLTARPVIGHQAVTRASSTVSSLYFVEGGTGHVYKIDLATGAEERVSNITVPVARMAAISKDGRYAAVRSGEGLAGELIIITLPVDGGELSSHTLGEASDNFEFNDRNELLYSVKSVAVTILKSFDPTTKDTTTLYEVPFREAEVTWDKTDTGAFTVYPKSGSGLPGALYTIGETGLKRLNPEGYGFGAKTLHYASIYSAKRDGQYRSYIYNALVGASIEIDQVFIPEKCTLVMTQPELVWGICAHTPEAMSGNLPDGWYTGERSFSDQLTAVDLTNLIVTPLINTKEATGRNLDITDLRFSGDAKQVFFTNRTDRSLWVFDVSWPYLVE